MEKIKERLKELMNEGSIDMIIGYGKQVIPVIGDKNIVSVCPVFIKEKEDIDLLVWNRHCVRNLTVYLTKNEYKSTGKTAIFVKPCDLKALNILLQEKQIDKDMLYIIGLTCNGVISKKMGIDEGCLPDKCILCMERNKGNISLGAGGVDIIVESLPEGEQPPQRDKPLPDLQALKNMSQQERWQFWSDQFKKCLRCYACRSVCPMCYCTQCISNMSQPQWLNKSPNFKSNFMFHIIRALHLAGRCVGCGECERSCPMGLPLTLINTYMRDIVKELYDYEPGENPEESPLLSQFKTDDDQSFIK